MKIEEHLISINSLMSKIGRPIKLMEVCGTHTMSAFRCGLRSILPFNFSLLSGPGCPVCVTPNDYLDKAIAISKMPKTIITTFGDMIRVPGTESSLEYARASGAKIEVVYSPAEALIKAKQNPGFKVIFLGVGFETTIPAIAWTIKEADLKNIDNFYVLCAHKTIPQAMAALMKGKVKINGFMCPGHVSVIIGGKAYNQICRDFKIPCVVTGFEPLDMVLGIEMLLQQIADKRAEVEIQYSRSVSERGNLEAQAIIQEVFDVCDSKWRGVGTIPQSGLVIKDKYSSFDAEKEFTDLKVPSPKEHKDCICGEILQGIKLPYDCKLFRKKCTPDTPVGACMVSGEGTCAAYYKYSEREGHV